MQKLIQQLIKFGFVGAICFVIDYVVRLIVLNIIMVMLSTNYFDIASVIGSAVGFVVLGYGELYS